MATPLTNPAATTYRIDAAGRTLGRVASEAAHALLGKRSALMVKHRTHPITVVIENASQLHVSDARKRGKVYLRYTGYPGGQRAMTMAEMIEKKGIEEVVKKTIDGMIPRNKLRGPRMKNLIVKA